MEWIPLAMLVLLLGAVGLGAYLLGRAHGRKAVTTEMWLRVINTPAAAMSAGTHTASRNRYHTPGGRVDGSRT